MTPGEIEQAARQALAAHRLQEAESLLLSLLAGNTGPLHVWMLLAFAIRGQGRIQEARAIQEMLVEAAPGNLEARFELAETLLLLGDFQRGWREYHYRYNLAHTARLERKIQMPRWNGRRMDGKTLLIHDEQGYGDTFQFMRMLPWVKDRSGAHVVVQIGPEQASFARRMPGVDQVILRGELPPSFHMHCEMMSLPMVMGLQLADLPGPMPYLAALPERTETWRRRLAHLPRPLVALVWAGRPTHFNDANRSMSLNTMAPLAMPGIGFVSVQKGARAEEARTPPPGMALTDLSQDIGDFEDTAAILSVADLLISVDSAPVHLAGALGRPAWVLLPFVPDWRWLMDRADTPWYPSLRLFRQPAVGDWTTPMTRMAAALAAWRDGGGTDQGPLP